MNDELKKTQENIKILNLIGLLFLIMNTTFATIHFSQGKYFWGFFSVLGGIACLYVLVKNILK